MSQLVTNITYLMGIGTLGLHLALVAFILVTLLSANWREWLHEKVGSHGIWVSFVIVAASLVGSLFYSMVAGFSACLLCWVVRAFIYPQLVTLGAYFYKPHRWMLVVSLIGSIGATLVSSYQVVLQFSESTSTLCGLIPGLGDCQVEYFRIFGYVNIAVMSLTASLALVAAQVVVLHRKHWVISTDN